MKELFHHFFIKNWQRKLVAFLSAIAVWFLVNRSIEEELEKPHVETVESVDNREFLEIKAIVDTTADSAITEIKPDAPASTTSSIAIEPTADPNKRNDESPLDTTADSALIHELEISPDAPASTTSSTAIEPTIDTNKRNDESHVPLLSSP